MKIATLGCRHRHDADFGIGKGSNDGLRISYRQDVHHRRGHPRRRLVVGPAPQTGQKILCRQLVAHGLIGGQDTGPDDRPVVIRAGVEQIIQIDRLMGAVKIADTEMDDTTGKFLRIIGGNGAVLATSCRVERDSLTVMMSRPGK